MVDIASDGHDGSDLALNGEYAAAVVDIMLPGVGGLTIIVGIVMVGQPGLALATLTMILGVYFLVDGITTITAAFHVKPEQGWTWLLFNGVVTLVLAWMIIGEWPLSGVWAIGILVGVRLLFSGMTMLTLGSAGRMATKPVDSV